jgi:hypothetical protein
VALSARLAGDKMDRADALTDTQTTDSSFDPPLRKIPAPTRKFRVALSGIASPYSRHGTAARGAAAPFGLASQPRPRTAERGGGSAATLPEQTGDG